MISETLNYDELESLVFDKFLAYFALVNFILTSFCQGRAKQVVFEGLEFIIILLSLIYRIRRVGRKLLGCHREINSIRDRVRIGT